jgi:hypothetical protein
MIVVKRLTWDIATDNNDQLELERSKSNWDREERQVKSLAWHFLTEDNRKHFSYFIEVLFK